MFCADVEYTINHFDLKFQIKLQPGQIHALVGASGSGKTTLLRLLCGLLQPERGQIKCGDKILFDSCNKISLPPQKRNIGLIFQDYALFEHMTVGQNIGYGVSKVNQEYIVTDWLNRIGLKDKTNVYPSNLSGGERQRVALARALAAAPDVLLMDEPFAALNTQLRYELRLQLKQIIKISGIPVIVAIHDLKEAQLLADVVSVMSKGKLLQTGPVNEVFETPNSMLSAHALGWHNILKIREYKSGSAAVSGGVIPLEIPNFKNFTYIAFPADAIVVENQNPHIKGKILDVVRVRDRFYCDVQIDNDTCLQLELYGPELQLSVGSECGFKVNTDKAVFLP